MKSTPIKFSIVISSLALIIAYGVAQASGPMRPPQSPHTGWWGPSWWPTVVTPTMKITVVTKDENVTIETKDFPEDEDFTVTMGPMYTRGVNGYVVGTFNSGDGSSQVLTFSIPTELAGQLRISIRAQTGHLFPYYSYNWFHNNTTLNVTETADTQAPDEAAESENDTVTGDAAGGEAVEPGTGGASGLVGAVWNWVEFNDPVEGSAIIDQYDKYKVEFLSDGGMNIQADCNVGNGTYEADDEGSITITIGVMTLAMCEPESRSSDFVKYLGSSATFFFESGLLYIDTVADGGTMTLAAEAVEGELPVDSGSEDQGTGEGDPSEEGVHSNGSGQMIVASLDPIQAVVDESGVPSFKICYVVKDEEMGFLTSNFPPNEEFTIKMGVMPDYPQAVPYYDGKMKPPLAYDNHAMPMGQPMAGMGNKPEYPMPPKYSPGQNQPPMHPPVTWIPYYEAGTFTTPESGEIFISEIAIPAELAGAYKISIMMRTDHAYPYYAYNWFYNNDATVCLP